MSTWGSKYLAGMTIASFAGTIAYGIVTGGDLVGVVSSGYKGGVGEHTGYAILLVTTLVLAALTVFDLKIDDGDAESAYARAGAARPLPVTASRTPSYWGPLTGLGLACAALGIAVSSAFWILSVLILAVVGLEWTVQAWSDRATGDENLNRAMRGRVLSPIEVPLLSLLIVAIVVVGMSRIMLALPSYGSVVITGLAASLLFGVSIALVKGKATRSVISAVATVAVVAVAAAGIVGAAMGERDFHHGEEHSETHDGDDHSETDDGEDHSDDSQGDEHSEVEGEGE